MKKDPKKTRSSLPNEDAPNFTEDHTAAQKKLSAQASSESSEKRLRSIAILAPDLLWDSEPDGSTNWYNERWLEYTGQSFEEAIGWSWLDAIHPEDRKASARRYSDAVRNSKPLHQEHRIRRYDGEYQWFMVNALPVKDENGQVIKMYGAATDIHERKTAESKEREHRNLLEQEVLDRTKDLIDNKQLLQATLDSNPEMIQVFEAVRDKTGKIVDFIWILNNATSEKLYGEVLGKSLLQHNPGVIEEGIFKSFTEVTETGIPQQYEKHYVHEQFDGWFYQSVVKLNDGVATNTADITDRKKTELQLKETSNHLRSVFDTTLVQMSILEAIRNKQGKITDLAIVMVNKELEKGTGRKDLVGKSYGVEYPGIYKAGVFDMIIKTIETGEPRHMEYFYPHEGFNRWFSSSFVKFGDGVVATNRDISSIKETEERIRKLDAESRQEVIKVSLETLEEERKRISESLHNGLGQLLYGVKISLSGLDQADSAEFESAKKYALGLLTEAIKESRRISHELMPTMLEEFGLKAAIEDVCHQLTDGVKFKCKVTGAERKLDRYLQLAVYRTVQELMLNVVHHARATESAVVVNITDTEIAIKVKDNGQGFNENINERKGIGLASIKGKIKLLNGNISINSSKDKGTEVVVNIPIEHRI